MKIWSHHIAQNMNEKKLKNSALNFKAEFFKFFRSYFGQCDDFIFSFWNFLTFSSISKWTDSYIEKNEIELIMKLKLYKWIFLKKRPIYSTKIRYPQRANQEKKNELTYYYSSEENESLDGSFGDSAVVKYVFFFSDLLGPGLLKVS